MPESDIHEDGPSRNGPPTTTNTGGNVQCIRKQNIQWNRKARNISSNRHEILLGQIQNPTKPFPHIMVRGKEKHARLCHITPHHVTSSLQHMVNPCNYIKPQVVQVWKKVILFLKRNIKWLQYYDRNNYFCHYSYVDYSMAKIRRVE